MSFLSLSLFSLWFLSGVILPCLGQATSLFQWGFTNSSLSTKLPACTTLPISVKSRNVTNDDDEGTPPYYMTAYVLGGTPVTTLIGTDDDALRWTVNAPVGSQLVLNVVDATRSTGGVAALTYTVVAGTTTSCIATPSQNPTFRVTANVTGDLTTCQPWGLSITGGVPPYTVSLAQPNSFTVTNFSMPARTDRFTYINRVSPGSQLLAAVSDSTGRWAAGTPLVNAKGSTNTTCPGLVNSSVNSTVVTAGGTAAEADPASNRRKSILIIASTAVSAFLLLVGVLGVAVCMSMRRRRQKIRQEVEANTVPRQFTGQPTTTYVASEYSGSVSRSFNTSFSSLPSQTTTSSKTRLMNPRSLYIPSRPESSVASSSTASASQASAAAGSDITSPGDRTGPSLYSISTTAASFVRPSAKAVEAGVYLNRSPESEYQETALPDSSNVFGRIASTSTAADSMRGRPSQMPTVREYPEPGALYADPATGEIVACPTTGAGLQHVDEPPPPYADRRSRGLM